MHKLPLCLLLLFAACATEPEPAATEPAEQQLTSSLEIAGTIVQPGSKDPGEPGGPSVACYAYCADGYFYCPPNPAMECYWVCTLLCPIGGEPGCDFECVPM